MFDELNKFDHKGHFFFTVTDNLLHVCNAPTDKSGVYIVYALKDGRTELIYIGRSGQVKSNGVLFIRKANLGGLKDRLVNGRQFGSPRRNSWKAQMTSEKIEALEVYWYVTHNEQFVDCPKVLEDRLLKKHSVVHARRPRWNKT